MKRTIAFLTALLLAPLAALATGLGSGYATSAWWETASSRWATRATTIT